MKDQDKSNNQQDQQQSIKNQDNEKKKQKTTEQVTLEHQPESQEIQVKQQQNKQYQSNQQQGKQLLQNQKLQIITEFSQQEKLKGQQQKFTNQQTEGHEQKPQESQQQEFTNQQTEGLEQKPQESQQQKFTNQQTEGLEQKPQESQQQKFINQQTEGHEQKSQESQQRKFTNQQTEGQEQKPQESQQQKFINQQTQDHEKKPQEINQQQKQIVQQQNVYIEKQQQQLFNIQNIQKKRKKNVPKQIEFIEVQHQLDQQKINNIDNFFNQQAKIILQNTIGIYIQGQNLYNVFLYQINTTDNLYIAKGITPANIFTNSQQVTIMINGEEYLAIKQPNFIFDFYISKQEHFQYDFFKLSIKPGIMYKKKISIIIPLHQMILYFANKIRILNVSLNDVEGLYSLELIEVNEGQKIKLKKIVKGSIILLYNNYFSSIGVLCGQKINLLRLKEVIKLSHPYKFILCEQNVVNILFSIKQMISKSEEKSLPQLSYFIAFILIRAIKIIIKKDELFNSCIQIIFDIFEYLENIIENIQGTSLLEQFYDMIIIFLNNIRNFYKDFLNYFQKMTNKIEILKIFQKWVEQKHKGFTSFHIFLMEIIKILRSKIYKGFNVFIKLINLDLKQLFNNFEKSEPSDIQLQYIKNGRMLELLIDFLNLLLGQQNMICKIPQQALYKHLFIKQNESNLFFYKSRNSFFLLRPQITYLVNLILKIINKSMPNNPQVLKPEIKKLYYSTMMKYFSIYQNRFLDFQSTMQKMKQIFDKQIINSLQLQETVLKHYLRGQIPKQEYIQKQYSFMDFSNRFNNKIHIEAGKKKLLFLQSTKNYTLIFYKFKVKSNDIDIKFCYLADLGKFFDMNQKVLLNFKRVTNVQNNLLLFKTGYYTFIFDNKYSWFKSKTIEIQCTSSLQVSYFEMNDPSLIINKEFSKINQYISGQPNQESKRQKVITIAIFKNHKEILYQKQIEQCRKEDIVEKVLFMTRHLIREQVQIQFLPLQKLVSIEESQRMMRKGFRVIVSSLEKNEMWDEWLNLKN